MRVHARRRDQHAAARHGAAPTDPCRRRGGGTARRATNRSCTAAWTSARSSRGRRARAAGRRSVALRVAPRRRRGSSAWLTKRPAGKTARADPRGGPATSRPRPMETARRHCGHAWTTPGKASSFVLRPIPGERVAQHVVRSPVLVLPHLLVGAGSRHRKGRRARSLTWSRPASTKLAPSSGPRRRSTGACPRSRPSANRCGAAASRPAARAERSGAPTISSQKTTRPVNGFTASIDDSAERVLPRPLDDEVGGAARVARAACRKAPTCEANGLNTCSWYQRTASLNAAVSRRGSGRPCAGTRSRFKPFASQNWAPSARRRQPARHAQTSRDRAVAAPRGRRRPATRERLEDLLLVPAQSAHSLKAAVSLRGSGSSGIVRGHANASPSRRLSPAR